MTKKKSATKRDLRLSRKNLLRYILQDDPADRQNDCLGASSIVANLHEVFSLLRREQMFSGNVAVYAPWGGGKTTISRMLAEQLDEEGLLVSWFDSWNYDNKPVNIAVALLRNIESLLLRHGISSAMFADYCQAFARMSTSGEQLLSRAAESREAMAEYNGWIDQIESFRSRFGEVLKQALNDRQVAVFVDDLDRCTPHNVIFLLETIKNYLAVDNITFVVFMDKDVVKETVDSYYAYRKAFGNLYLEKVFPFEFYFKYPDVNYESLIEQALSEFFNDEDHIKRLKITFRILPYNPRRLKAILKKLFFQASFYTGTADDYERFLILVLSTYFPDYFDILRSLDERTALNFICAQIIFRELSEGLFKPEEREQQISKYPGMATYFNNDSLLDFLKLMDNTLRFREQHWSIQIRNNQRPIKRLLDSMALG